MGALPVRISRSLVYSLYFDAIVKSTLAVCEIVFTVGEIDRVPIVGFCLMSSRPALRPSLAAVKDFSHSFNSCRRAVDWS